MTNSPPKSTPFPSPLHLSLSLIIAGASACAVDYEPMPSCYGEQTCENQTVPSLEGTVTSVELARCQLTGTVLTCEQADKPALQSPLNFGGRIFAATSPAMRGDSYAIQNGYTVNLEGLDWEHGTDVAIGFLGMARYGEDSDVFKFSQTPVFSADELREGVVLSAPFSVWEMGFIATSLEQQDLTIRLSAEISGQSLQTKRSINLAQPRRLQFLVNDDAGVSVQVGNSRKSLHIEAPDVFAYEEGGLRPAKESDFSF